MESAWVGSSDQGQKSFDAAGANPIVAAATGAIGALTGNGDVAGHRLALVQTGVFAAAERRRRAGCPVRRGMPPVRDRDEGRRLARAPGAFGLVRRAGSRGRRTSQTAAMLPTGSWARPVGNDSGRVAAAGAESFFASAPLPSAWLAAVAVPRGGGTGRAFGHARAGSGLAGAPRPTRPSIERGRDRRSGAVRGHRCVRPMAARHGRLRRARRRGHGGDGATTCTTSRCGR